MKFKILLFLSLLFIAVQLHTDQIESIRSTHDRWLESWRQQDIETYLAFYHPDFTSKSSNQNYDQWIAHKRRVFTPGRPVEVVFTDIRWSSLRDSGVQFEATQTYRSRNYSDFGRKTITWIFEDGEPLIVNEEWTRMARPTEPILPPIEIEISKPDTLKPIWEARVGQVPFEYINFLFGNTRTTDPHLFIVEKKDQYAGLYRFRDGVEHIDLISTYFVSTGQNQGNKFVRGDLKTPEGLYFTIRFIPEAELEPKFGTGAFVLDYPNEMDRLRRKTGSGIWIHGSDEEMKHFDTEGCIRFENEYITYFHEELNLNRTPVIVNDVLEWTDVATLRAEVKKIKSLMDAWKESWEKQVLSTYLDFYSQDFVSHNQKMNYQQWEAHKERVFGLGNTVNIKLSDFNYHYADNLLLISFMQDYRAGSYQDFGRKQLILLRDGSSWKIIQEEWTARK